MVPAFGMAILPQNISTGNGQVPGWSCILSVATPGVEAGVAKVFLGHEAGLRRLGWGTFLFEGAILNHPIYAYARLSRLNTRFYPEWFLQAHAFEVTSSQRTDPCSISITCEVRKWLFSSETAT